MSKSVSSLLPTVGRPSKAARNVQARNRKDAAVKAAPVPAVAKGKKVAPKAEVAAKQVKVTKAPKADIACRCECGGLTKGGKFLPGHDARHASNLVAEYTRILVTDGPVPSTTKARLSLQAEADAVSAAFGAKVAKAFDRACATA